MSEPTNFITQAQYDHYTSDWLELLNNGSGNALQQAFQTPGVARVNFSTFSIDQILALVSADGAHLIKARFLLMPDAPGLPNFSITLFAVDASGHVLTNYYIPTQAATTTSQAVAPADEASTQIKPEVAWQWLTDWVDATELTIAEFTTSHGPLHGYNFEVSTFKDPLAGAQPYANKNLFLNYGLSTEAEATLIALVVYVGPIGSRIQGNLESVPADGPFYDIGGACPPSP